MKHSCSDSQIAKLRHERYRLNTRKARKVDDILDEIRGKLTADHDVRHHDKRKRDVDA